jgi:S-adenosylmethionine decarboxylase proenzyme
VEERKYPPTGTHVICEFGGCRSEDLANIEFLKDMLQRAVEAAGGTSIGTLYHQFEDGGATVVVGLQESHASIHTWPEDGYASFDMYTCGSDEHETGKLESDANQEGIKRDETKLDSR